MTAKPGGTVTTEALEEANRQLRLLEDAHREEEGSVPPWLIAARLTVDKRLRSRKHD